MRAIFLNWRDLVHPRSGGMEVLTQGLAQRLAASGHHITFFSASVSGQPADEVQDGVRHVRRGGRYGVYRGAYDWLRAERPPYDLLIDTVNTIPFFTPLYERTRAIAFVPQLARDVWWYEAPKLVAPAGVVGEHLFHAVYRSIPGITISESTARDLRAFGWRGQIRTISMPTSEHAPREAKQAEPTILFVGRLTPSKRVEHAIEAFSIVRSRLPRARLWIVGAADDAGYERRLRAQSERVGGIEFVGRVDDVERPRRMAAAHVLVVPSVREGWGLVVTEANRVGTPAVGYDVAGLRDSIKPGQGVLVRPGDTRALGDALADTLSNQRGLAMMSSRARADASQYTWKRTFDEFVQALRDLKPDLVL
jgi:glycosyltransferase involved in cell wall biosynthesis